jgi:hypothetical protein
MPAKAGIQAGRLRACLVDSRFRGNDECGTQLSSWAKPAYPIPLTDVSQRASSSSSSVIPLSVSYRIDPNCHQNHHQITADHVLLLETSR